MSIGEKGGILRYLLEATNKKRKMMLKEHVIAKYGNYVIAKDGSALLVYMKCGKKHMGKVRITVRDYTMKRIKKKVKCWGNLAEYDEVVKYLETICHDRKASWRRHNYQNFKEKINKYRRDKYANDPAYRERTLRQRREWWQRKRCNK